MPRRHRRTEIRDPLHPMKSVLNFVAWLTGMLVSLSVGFAMMSSNLLLPTWLGGAMASMVVGWAIVLVTLVGVIVTIFTK